MSRIRSIALQFVRLSQNLIEIPIALEKRWTSEGLQRIDEENNGFDFRMKHFFTNVNIDQLINSPDR